MFVELLVVFILIIVYVYYKFVKNNNRYYDDRNLKSPGLLFGLKNLYSIILGRSDLFEMSRNLYNLFPDEP